MIAMQTTEIIMDSAGIREFNRIPDDKQNETVHLAFENRDECRFQDSHSIKHILLFDDSTQRFSFNLTKNVPRGKPGKTKDDKPKHCSYF